MGWPGENGVSFAMSRVVCGERPDRDLQASASPLDGVEVVEGRWMILTSRTHYWRWEWTQTDERFFCERTAQEDWNPVILLLIIKTYRRHLAQKTYFEHSMFFLSALALVVVRTSTIETFFYYHSNIISARGWPDVRAGDCSWRRRLSDKDINQQHPC